MTLIVHRDETGEGTPGDECSIARRTKDEWDVLRLVVNRPPRLKALCCWRCATKGCGEDDIGHYCICVVVVLRFAIKLKTSNAVAHRRSAAAHEGRDRRRRASPRPPS